MGTINPNWKQPGCPSSLTNDVHLVLKSRISDLASYISVNAIGVSKDRVQSLILVPRKSCFTCRQRHVVRRFEMTVKQMSPMLWHPGHSRHGSGGPYHAVLCFSREMITTHHTDLQYHMAKDNTAADSQGTRAPHCRCIRDALLAAG